MMGRFGIVLLVAGALAACGPATEPEAEGPAQDAIVAAPAAPAAPPGPPEAIPPYESDLQQAASVFAVTPLSQQPHMTKLFSTVGGDPAINGEYVFVAVRGEAPVEPWSIFRVADVNRWSLASEKPGEVVLKISRSWIDESGEVKTGDETLFVTVPEPGASEIVVRRSAS